MGRRHRAADESGGLISQSANEHRDALIDSVLAPSCKSDRDGAGEIETDHSGPGGNRKHPPQHLLELALRKGKIDVYQKEANRQETHVDMHLSPARSAAERQ